MPSTASYHIYPCGDHALTIELGDRIDLTTNRKVMALYSQLKASDIKGLQDIIPAYHSITLIYDTVFLKKQVSTTTVYEWVSKEVEKLLEKFKIVENQISRKITIPVCYDERVAPDILELSLAHKMTIADLIRIHCGIAYRVYMIGFLPGFAYMGSVDPSIASPRKASPRTIVPKGSVGIAGEQTGIYPFDSPGGWQLIGRTPLLLFDQTKPSPCLLEPGDEVQFYPITYEAFQNFSKA